MTTFSVELDLTVLEQLDFAPPCEYLGADLHNGEQCGKPAEWLFIGLQPLACGCIMPDRHFCTECKGIRQWWPTIACVRCGFARMYNDPNLYRFERIDGTS